MRSDCGVAAILLACVFHATARPTEPLAPRKRLTRRLHFMLNDFEGDPTCVSIFPTSLRDNGYILDVPAEGLSATDPPSLDADRASYNGVQCDPNSTAKPFLFPRKFPPAVDLATEKNLYALASMRFFRRPPPYLEWAVHAVVRGNGAVPCPYRDRAGALGLQRMMFLYHTREQPVETIRVDKELVFKKNRIYMVAEQTITLPDGRKGGDNVVCILVEVKTGEAGDHTQGTSSGSSTPTNGSQERDNVSRLPTATVVGVVVGGVGTVLGLGVVAAAGIFWRRQRRRAPAANAGLSLGERDAISSSSDDAAGHIVDITEQLDFEN